MNLDPPRLDVDPPRWTGDDLARLVDLRATEEQVREIARAAASISRLYGLLMRAVADAGLEVARQAERAFDGWIDWYAPLGRSRGPVQPDIRDMRNRAEFERRYRAQRARKARRVRKGR